MVTILEEEAPTDKIGDNIVLIDKRGGTTAQGLEMKDKTAEQGQEETIHLKKAGGTLVTDEGDAKRPLVMEGLLQASQ